MAAPHRKPAAPPTPPNLYFYVFVFRKGEAPVVFDSTIHRRAYAGATRELVVHDRLEDIVDNRDRVPDMAKDGTGYEVRIVDAPEECDGNEVLLRERLQRILAEPGYERALHWQLAAITVHG